MRILNTDEYNFELIELGAFLILQFGCLFDFDSAKTQLKLKFQ